MIPDPTLLLVEDDHYIRRELANTFARSPETRWERFGLRRFQVDEADTGESAEQRFEVARVTSPYDVVIFDLGLPWDAKSKRKDDSQVGLSILKAIDKKCARAVVVASAHGEKPDVLIDLIRSRVVFDFIQKPWKTNNDDLYEAVAHAYHQGQQHFWNELRRHHAEQWLVVQARAQVADDMALIVSRGVDDVLNHLETLQRNVEGYCLSALDLEHPLSLRFLDLKRSARLVLQKCANERTRVSSNTGKMEATLVDKLLREIVTDLRSGFSCLRLGLEGAFDTGYSVHTFPEIVRDVLKEVLLGAMLASKPDDTLRMESVRDPVRHALHIRVTDRTEFLGEYVQRSLADALPVEEERSKRGWRLSLAQRIANNIGARIKLEEAVSGNTVTLSIPVTAADAESDR